MPSWVDLERSHVSKREGVPHWQPLLAVSTALFALLWAGPAAAQTLDDLFKLYRTDDQRVDFIVVVDQSGSMRQPLAGTGGRTRFDAVRQAALLLADTTRPGDYLAVVGFSNQAVPLVPGRLVGTDVSDLRQTIQLWPLPTGQKTDIGAALEESVAQMGRTHPNPIQFLFFLTDGIHDPPVGSPYQSLDSAAWTRLAEMAPHATAGRIVSVTGLALASNTDIDLIRRVWKGASVLPHSKTALESFFTELRDQVRRVKLAAQIEEDLRTITLRPSSAPEAVELREGEVARLSLAIERPNPRIELRVDSVRVSGGTEPISIAAWQTTRSSTDQRVGLGELTLRAAKPSLIRVLVNSLLLKERRVEVPVRIEVAGSVLPDALLRNILLRTPAWSAGTSATVAVVLLPGVRPIWTWASVLCVAGIVGGAWYCRRANKAKGSLKIWRTSTSIAGAVRIDLQNAMSASVPVLWQRAGRGLVWDGRPEDTVVLVVRARRCGRIQEAEVVGDYRIADERSGVEVQTVRLEDGMRFKVDELRFEYGL